MIVTIKHGTWHVTSFVCDAPPRVGEMVCYAGKNWRVTDVVWGPSQSSVGKTTVWVDIQVVPAAADDDPTRMPSEGA